MKISFGSTKLHKQMQSEADIVRAFRWRAKQVILRLSQIEYADNLMVLQSLPSLKCRQLATKPDSLWQLDITPNFSLLFGLDHDPVPLMDDGTLSLSEITNIKLMGIVAH
jgi:proteic killer suppression protein